MIGRASAIWLPAGPWQGAEPDGWDENAGLPSYADRWLPTEIVIFAARRRARFRLGLHHTVVTADPPQHQGSA